MTSAEFVGPNSTAPVQAQPYRPSKIDKPPTVEDLVRSLKPVGMRSSTAPIPLSHTTYMILSISGKAQIIIPQVKKIDSKISEERTIEKINYVKQKFQLSVIQLAELFNVTRKSVYDWYDGAEPKNITAERINVIRSLEDFLDPEIDVTKLKAYWKIPVSGTSFLSLLSNDSLGRDHLRVALIEKINELSPRMGSTNSSKIWLSKSLPSSQLADIDRAGDIS